MSPVGPILVVNPNCDVTVTASLDKAVAGLRFPGGPAIECVTLHDSPPGIMSQRDVDTAGVRVADLARSRPDASALVIGCYSQPGLDLTRSETRRPVYGQQDAGVLAALALADRFGVIAVAEASIPRHLRNLAKLGVLDRLVDEVAPERVLTVAESGDAAIGFAPILKAAEALKRRGAGAIVLGCSGMSPLRAMLEDALDLPVIDGIQAAVGLALSRLATEAR